MTRHQQALKLLVVTLLGAGATACGATATTPAALAHAHHHPKSAPTVAKTSTPSPSPSVSPSSTPEPSTTPSSVPPSLSVSPSTSTSVSSSSSSVPVQTPSTPPQPVVTAEPPVGGVTNPNQVQAAVNTVQAEGTVTVNGTPERLYLLNVTLHNPTPAMILFALNDIIVGPGNANPGSSRNDYVLTGVTASNSLFPYPIVPQHAEAVVVRVPSNRSVTGDFTVEVPVASSYSVWISGDNAPIAMFSA
ncbi:MAG: hypothetical protein OWU84_07640 [Firmicutes bacterium]|nr:hypothetical protein [Bacillota bacterium]